MHGAPLEQVVLLEDVRFSYTASKPLLNGISLSVSSGEVLMILGRSGAGKTTLLKIIKGFLKPSRGSVQVLGGEPHESIQEVAYIPQGLGLVRNSTVLENTLLGALGRISVAEGLVGRFPDEVIDEASETIERLGVQDKVNEKVHRLSGGQKQRVAIARALMQHPKVILADEFISQLDPVTAYDVMDDIVGLSRDGVTLVITTHDMDKVPIYGDRAVLVQEGSIVYAGPAKDLTLETVKELLG
jgi:phosphonate transport system ATP-binding protein